MKKIITFASLFTLTALTSLWSQVTIIDESFEAGPGNGPGAPVWVPTEPTKNFSFWYTSKPETWVWQGNQDVNPDSLYALLPLHSSGIDGSSWIYRNLGEGKGIAEITLDADMFMQWGGDEDPKLYFLLALLDSNGNGYVAEFGRAGKITIYRADHGVEDPSSWAQIASGTSNAGNRQKLSFQVEGGVVKAESSISSGSIVSAEDKTYASFSKVGISDIAYNGAFTTVYSVSVKGKKSGN